MYDSFVRTVVPMVVAVLLSAGLARGTDPQYARR
jgi:hypothetical protein